MNLKEQNKLLKANISHGLINTPERLQSLIAILIRKDILDLSDVKEIYEDDSN